MDSFGVSSLNGFTDEVYCVFEIYICNPTCKVILRITNGTGGKGVNLMPFVVYQVSIVYGEFV